MITTGLTQSATAADKPNIIFILADDLGWTDLGSFGSDYYQTPHLDQLAKQGMKFTNAYANAPNCAPTRACLLSGQYPPRHGIYTVGSGARGKAQHRKMIPAPNETTLKSEYYTLGEAIQDAGYKTAHFGKWHMGGTEQTLPQGQGFPHNRGGFHAGHPKSYFSPYKNPQLKDGPKGENLTDRLSDEVVHFIKHNKAKPFFVYLPYYAVHTPIQPKQDLKNQYAAKPKGKYHDNPAYAAMITTMDQGIGRILKTLDELNLSENTLIVFTSDNGGLGGYREAGLKGGGKSITQQHPLRGGKGMLYEGGIRVPLIVKWPGVTKPGSISHQPVISFDFYPTLINIAGGKTKPNQTPDGIDITPLLKNPNTQLKREALYWHFPGYLQLTNNGVWRTTPGAVIRFGDWKLHEYFEDGRLELYNLKDDISEQNNLAQTHPDITRKLHTMMKTWRKNTNAPMPKMK